MNRNFRLTALLAGALLFVGFSYSFRLECDIAVAGSISAATATLEQTITKNGGEFVRPPSGEDGWYSIDGANLSFSHDGGRLHVSCAVVTGSGCAKSAVEERTRELIEKLVAQASQESGIKMQILEIREAKK